MDIYYYKTVDMNFLINLWQKATKGDNFRIPDNVVTYNDKVAQLNSNGPNSKLTTSKIQKISKSNAILTPNGGGHVTIPGAR